MNIVTFATAVSVAPPKLWAVSLYHDTLTKDSFLKSGTGVLQLLAPSQKMLIPALGKRSGYEAGYSKPDACADLGFAWVTCRRRNLGLSSAAADHSYDRMELLPACSSYIFLKLVSTVEAGDHLVALCQVTGTGVWDEGGQTVLPVQENALPRCLDPSSALYTGQLRQDDIL
jgi:flavin reductase (DIM6/NTAB) family NADH-FMN oxidoreductase RutF